MNLTVAFLIALLLIIAGCVLIYMTLRGNERFRPTDAFQWAAVIMSSVLVLTASFLLVLLANYTMPAQPGAVENAFPTVDAANFDKPAPDFQFRTLEGDAVSSLSEYKGQVVVLNFWATWCGPCLMELPDLNRLQQTYADQGLVVLTVSDEDPGRLQEFAASRPFETVAGYVTEPGELPEVYRMMLQLRPMTFFVDRDGILRDVAVGAGDFEGFSATLQPLLAGSVGT